MTTPNPERTCAKRETSTDEWCYRWSGGASVTLGLSFGATRMVVLTRRLAIKLPRPTGWASFLTGLLGNMQERRVWSTRDARLCPVLASLPGGWLVVMPRAQPLTDEQWQRFDPEQFCAAPSDEARAVAVPAERKRDSYGVWNGRVVAVDYGSYGG